jgi:Transposase DDE domain
MSGPWKKWGETSSGAKPQHNQFRIERSWKKLAGSKRAHAWRTGCEGRISVLKRRHGLRRCLYRGMEGMKRWVGLGVLADNLINIGKVMSTRA